MRVGEALGAGRVSVVAVLDAVGIAVGGDGTAVVGRGVGNVVEVFRPIGEAHALSSGGRELVTDALAGHLIK